MTDIKTLKNNAFRRLVGALVSVMFVVLLGGYRWHIHTTDNKLSVRTEPMEELTQRLLTQSGSNDGLIGSSIAAKEALISGLDLTPSVTAELRRYISNMYTAAGAYESAKTALPQTNDRTYLFHRGTIDLLQSNSFLSGDVLALYSGRQTIQSAIGYLSGSAVSTNSAERKKMSSHNLSVALASQIGIEISLCTRSYEELAHGRTQVSELASGLLASYDNQQRMISTLKTNDPKTAKCLEAYKTQLTKNTKDLMDHMPLISKLESISVSRSKTYSETPLQCPLGVDLYNDIISVRSYLADVRVLALTTSSLESMILSGNLKGITQACESMDTENSTGSSLEDILKPLDEGAKRFSESMGTGGITNSGSYDELPEDTTQIIQDIYDRNMQYIKTMQQVNQDASYRPLRFLDTLFREFYGDSSEFIH